MTSSPSSKTCVPVTLLTLLLIGQISAQDATVTYQVREELRPDTYIGSVALDSELFTDISNEKFKLLHFQILKEGNKDVDYFKIEKETSFLWTKSVIDREKFTECFETCLIEFNIAVFDLEEADFTFVIKVEITLQDYNDNAPEFINIESPVMISESKSVGSIIVSGAAVDLDKGKDNSVKSYSFLQSSDVFDLRTVQTGQNTPEFELYLKAELDRETVTSYSLVILAKDGGEPQQTGTLTLEILVIDDNDNTPVFDTREYSTSVVENFALNRTVLQLHASDIDSGENGHVSYKFSNTIADKILHIFNIKETTGELVTVGYIDFEKDKEFSFVVVAFDHGNPSQSSSASIYINVIDVNDNSPIINLNQPPGGTVISELAEIGSFITHLEIIDLDSDENGKIECNISDNHFGIESVPDIENNYKIVLSTMLDHDTTANHNVTIFCHDLGDPPRQTYANFMVHVEDVNDHIPVFTENVYAVTVDENNELDASVLTVSAVDHDSGNYGQVSYSLHADSDGLFKINSFTGVIRANVSLDRETHGDQVLFRVLAIDKSDEPQTSTGTCVVNINDLNDNAPSFDPDSLQLYVYENQLSGAQVGNITAKDPDNGVNGTFVYKFPDDPDVLEYFSFNETGLITTNKILDREVLPVHTFMVEAIDMGGKTGSARITIYVRDLNDNSPEIIYPNEYDDTVSIPFSFPVSSEVLRIEARDYDTGDNARLYYFIDSDNASYAFVLNVITGSVFLNRSLHEKDIGQIFQFHMQVKDGGIPALTATTKLNIHITEVVMGYLSEDRSSQRNLWIVIAIVIVTTVLSAIIIIIIIKMCWCGQGKSENGSTAEIISDSNDLDPRYSDSFSAISSSSKDSNSNMKSKDEVYQIKDGYQGGYYSNMDEKDYSKSSLDCHSAYIEQLKVMELHKKLDETTSDNSAELGTRDSGQGGSDLDNISLSELPPLTEVHDNTTSALEKMGDKSFNTDNYHNSFQHSLLPGNQNSDMNSDSVIMPQSVSFSHVPAKTAERKELGKLRRSKRVMFSDDLENSHSSGRSSTMSTQSFFDLYNVPSNPESPRRFSRMLSEDSAIELPDRISRTSSWLRRSADNLKWQQNMDKLYNQLPSNRIKFGTYTDFRNKPIGSNIRTYLTKVMDQTRHNSLNDYQTEDTQRSTGSNNVFTMTGSFVGSQSSRDTESTTTSGSYSLGQRTLSLVSPSVGSEDVFVDDIEI